MGVFLFTAELPESVSIIGQSLRLSSWQMLVNSPGADNNGIYCAVEIAVTLARRVTDCFGDLGGLNALVELSLVLVRGPESKHFIPM